QGVVGVAYLHREQPAFDPALRREISSRRGDRDGICGIDGERSGEQTILQEAANAMVQRRCAVVVTDPCADARRGAECYLSALVSGHGPSGRGDACCGIIPRSSLLSSHTLATDDLIGINSFVKFYVYLMVCERLTPLVTMSSSSRIRGPQP